MIDPDSHSLSLPEDGLYLEGDPDLSMDLSNPENAPIQVMQLNLPDSVLEDCKRIFRTGKRDVQVLFGKKPALQLGPKERQLHAAVSRGQTNMYRTSSSKDRSILEYAGTLSHKFDMSKAPSAPEADDAALMELQTKLADHEKQKQNNTTIFVKDGSSIVAAKSGIKFPQKKTPAFLKAHRTGLFDRRNGTTKSMPTSPSVGATRSPTSTEATKVSSSTAPLDERSMKVQALKVPLLHLLAIRPVSEKFLAKSLNCSSDECMQILQKYGRPARLDPSKWDLSDRGFKELDVWKFSYPSQEDRQAAIDRAISAYDRQHLSREEKLWQLLLPKQERGKGKILSRLDFRKGPIKKVATPLINIQPTDDLQTGGGYATGNDSSDRKDRLAPSDAEPMARSKSHDSINKKKVSEKEAQSKRLLSKNPKKPIQTSKPKESKPKESKPAAKREVKKDAFKPDASRVKSAEFVHDSDEDVEMGDYPPVTIGEVQPASSVEPAKGHATNKSKPSPASKSTTNTETVEQPKKAEHSSNGTKARNGAKVTSSSSLDSSTPKTRQPDANQSTDSAPMKKSYSHQRTTSSPIKPSPLGSSPPTNASDLDTGAHHGSSSSSSPLISQSRKANAMVNSNDKTGVTRKISKPAVQPATPSSNGLKRKANDLDSDIHKHGTAGTGSQSSLTNGNFNKDHHSPPAKRQQISQGQSRTQSQDKAQLSSTPPLTSDSGSNSNNSDGHSPPLAPPSTSSQTSNTTASTTTISTSHSTNGSGGIAMETIEMAQRFKNYWAKYERLYKGIADQRDPKQEEVERVLRMHERLQGMKRDIENRASGGSGVGGGRGGLTV